MEKIKYLKKIHQQISECRVCPQMCGTPVHGPALDTDIVLVGQAPGPHEADRGKPFAYTAGKTLFKWLGQSTGMNELEIRDRIYIAAIARCFPGKNLKGAGDREPSADEIGRCSIHLEKEIKILKPKIILAVGRVAITEVLGKDRFTKTTPLIDVVGKKLTTTFHGHVTDVICLPHPSGVSRWPIKEPGKTKLAEALKILSREFKKLEVAS